MITFGKWLFWKIIILENDYFRKWLFFKWLFWKMIILENDYFFKWLFWKMIIVSWSISLQSRKQWLGQSSSLEHEKEVLFSGARRKVKISPMPWLPEVIYDTSRRHIPWKALLWQTSTAGSTYAAKTSRPINGRSVNTWLSPSWTHCKQRRAYSNSGQFFRGRQRMDAASRH